MTPSSGLILRSASPHSRAPANRPCKVADRQRAEQPCASFNSCGTSQRQRLTVLIGEPVKAYPSGAPKRCQQSSPQLSSRKARVASGGSVARSPNARRISRTHSALSDLRSRSRFLS
jgi:hypothetical protein